MLKRRNQGFNKAELGSCSQPGVPVKSINISSSAEDLARYRKAFTRILRNVGEVVDIKKKFLEEGIFTIRVTLLGPNLCLLEDLEGNDVEVFIEEKKIWWEQWFLSIKPWHPHDVDTEILVWLMFMGVPCHDWGERLFKAIGNKIGFYVKSEEETLLKTRMDEARVCIRYWGMEMINSSFCIFVDGSKYMVHVVEILNDSKPLHNRGRWRDDNSSESDYSSGEEEGLEGKKEGRGRVTVTEQKGVGGGGGFETVLSGMKSGIEGDSMQNVATCLKF